MTTTNNPETFVTIWSKSKYNNLWLVERTHSLSYCVSLGISAINEVVEIAGRLYCAFNEGVNPNK